jgi:hypothetical protein
VGEFWDTSAAAVGALIPDAILVPGVFPESAKAVKFARKPIAFVHVDCDQYESVARGVPVLPAGHGEGRNHAV